MTDVPRPVLWALLGGLAALALAIGLYARWAGGLSRFEQTSFACAQSLIGPFELVINDRRVGATARLLRPEGETPVEITARGDEGLTLAAEGVALRVDPDTALVVVMIDTRLAQVRCRKTEFRM
ncbi:MAG: hypothetical protein ACO3BE_05460 [Gemmobacter sp.]|jgi:hypothetical protein